MLTKKDFQQLADITSEITDIGEREKFISKIIPFCQENNDRFEPYRFKEWVNRRINGEPTRGLG